MSSLEVSFFVAAPTCVLALVLLSFRTEIRRDWRAILFLAAACLIFFHRIIFLSEAVSQTDANQLQVQFFSLYRQAVLEFGEIPFWNPHEAAGLPNLAHPLSAMFYPLTPLFLIFDVFRALSVFIVSHFFLAALFALFLGRRLFSSSKAAIAFALLYAFNGYALTRIAHQPAVEYLFAYAWLPLIVCSFERALNGKRLLPSVVAVGAGLAWMGIACPNLFVFAALLLALACTVRVIYLASAKRTNALALAVFAAFASCLFALALGAVELFPALELSRFSTSGRLGQILPPGWRTQPLSPLMMLKLFFPFPGARPFGAYYSPGIVAVLLALFAVYKAVKVPKFRPLAASCAVVMLVGGLLLTQSLAYDVLIRLAPIVARASLVPAALPFLFVPVLLLAGAGVDSLAEHRRLLGPRGWLPVALVFLELFAVFVVIYPRWGSRRLTFDYQKEVADFPHLDVVANLPHHGRIAVYAPPEGEILAPSYATLPRGLSRLNPHLSAFAPDKFTDLTDRLRRRVDPYALEVLGVSTVLSTETLYDFETELSVPWPSVSEHLENSIFTPLRNQPGWLDWDKTVRIYPLARPAHGPPRPDGSRPRCARAAPSPQPAPSRLIFAVTAYPGWRFYADGHEVQAQIAASTFFAIDVPENSREVLLLFRPTHWTALLIAAVAAFALALAAVAYDLSPPTTRTPPAR